MLVAAAVLVVAALIAAIAFVRSDAGKARRRGVKVTAAVAAAVSFLGVMPLMGIPGAVVYELSVPWVRLALGEGYADLGDGAWPMAILMTMAWPWSLLLGYVAAYGPLRDRPWTRRLALVLVPCAAGVALALSAHL